MCSWKYRITHRKTPLPESPIYTTVQMDKHRELFFLWGLATKIILISRSGCSQMFFNIDVLTNFINFTEKHLSWSFFLMTLQARETPTLVFSCGICGIFKNTFLYRTLPVAGSGFRIFESGNERLPLGKLSSFIFSYWSILAVHKFLE